MIKKILVISIFSISFLFASNLIQQKRAEAEIIEGVGESEIRDSWKDDIEIFKKIRKKYLLY